MSQVKYGSVCSGIEAATVAWHPLGWKPQWFAEIDKFPSAVLNHHYPTVKNHGDFTRITADDSGPIDLLVGGTPCQSFSVAGKRLGLDDPRGHLTLEFLALAKRLKPRWIVWENVPGVLSDDRGRTFGTFLGLLGQLGYGFAYRVLDAQFFGVPQRRRRVFVVGCFGDWRSAAAVLFEPEGVRGNIAARREAGEAVAALTSNGVGTCGADDNQAQAGHIIPILEAGARTGKSTDDIRAGLGIGEPGDPMFTLQSSKQHAIAKCLNAEGVRRLTPIECERLQGFPDNYTNTPCRNKTAADGPRYKALGNSMAVPVMAWIGKRINIINNLEANQ